ncbi:hypothetical protein ACFSL6_27320 [Paenibacillus thailandensis]|uniref:Uncharacterized protein n=1 Tax=Paenibacillus thailandensis TaxID=393250 RepID=A0ABW5QRN3_9BACL
MHIWQGVKVNNSGEVVPVNYALITSSKDSTIKNNVALFGLDRLYQTLGVSKQNAVILSCRRAFSDESFDHVFGHADAEIRVNSVSNFHRLPDKGDYSRKELEDIANDFGSTLVAYGFEKALTKEQIIGLAQNYNVLRGNDEIPVYFFNKPSDGEIYSKGLLFYPRGSLKLKVADEILQAGRYVRSKEGHYIWGEGWFKKEAS